MSFIKPPGDRDPYAFDTNDMQFQSTNRFRGASDFADYALEAFEWALSRACTRQKGSVNLCGSGTRKTIVPRDLMQQRRPHPTCSSPRRGARGVIELT